MNAGADPRAACSRKPLEVVACRGHCDAVRFMISRVGLAGCGGETAGALALELAACAGHIKVLRTLTNFDVQDTGGVLVSAANKANQECVKFLMLQYEKQPLSDINSATDANERNALARAAGKGHYKIVQWLQDAGADAAGTGTVRGTRTGTTALGVVYTMFSSAQTDEDK